MKCLFCDMAQKKTQTNIVYEDEMVLAFHDINPQAPVHVLVIPKKHIRDFDNLKEEDRDLVFHLSQAIQKVAEDQDIQGAYRVVSNCGSQAGQSVFHLHFHILGGRAMKWPPG